MYKFARKFPRAFCLLFAVLAPFYWLCTTLSENFNELTEGYKDAWKAFKKGSIE